MLANSIIPTHKAAEWLLREIDRLLDFLGLEHAPDIEEAIYLAVIMGVALAVGWLVRVCIVWVVRKIVRVRDGAVGRGLLKHHVIQKYSHFIPPLVFLGLVPFAVVKEGTLIMIVDRLAAVYAVVATAYGLGAVLSFVFDQINSRHNRRHLPIRGILNVILGIVWIVTAIIAVSILLDKSPATLLAGLGAFAAALMLIFKDSILGFVAGLQMSENDMVHVGDWILVPGTPANGIVRDVSLSTVKIQNFDNTMVMVPPYTLVSEAFQNWDGMKVRHARRVKRALRIDMTSIRRLNPEEVRRLAGEGYLGPDTAETTAAAPINLTLFRHYAEDFLRRHPEVVHEESGQWLMARQLEPTSEGLPLELWFYFREIEFVRYEDLAAEVMEHLIAALPAFGLRLFQLPGGNDFARLLHREN